MILKLVNLRRNLFHTSSIIKSNNLLLPVNFNSRFNFEHAVTEKELENVKSLIHQVLVDELSWIPPKENPINLKIKKTKDGKNIYEDDYCKYSHYIGAYDKSKLIGAIRIVRKNPLTNKLPINYYTPLLDNYENIFEYGRMVVKPEYRKHGIGNDMLRYIFAFAKINNHGGAAYTDNLSLQKFFEQRLLIKPLGEMKFMSKNTYKVFIYENEKLDEYIKKIDMINQRYAVIS